jgi:hypothetical protein
VLGVVVRVVCVCVCVCVCVVEACIAKWFHGKSVSLVPVNSQQRRATQMRPNQGGVVFGYACFV